jgi:hypothetical protein
MRLHITFILIKLGYVRFVWKWRRRRCHSMYYESSITYLIHTLFDINTDEDKNIPSNWNRNITRLLSQAIVYSSIFSNKNQSRMTLVLFPVPALSSWLTKRKIIPHSLGLVGPLSKLRGTQDREYFQRMKQPSLTQNRRGRTESVLINW